MPNTFECREDTYNDQDRYTVVILYSKFACTELNANELIQKSILIYIEFGTCEVRH